jgi:hypothetical protein
MAQTMVRWIPFKVHTDSYTYFYHYYLQQYTITLDDPALLFVTKMKMSF